MTDKMPVLYSLGCPKCVVLERKLKELGAGFKVCNDLESFAEAGITEIPMLLADGVLMNFTQSIEWINKQKAEE